MAKESSISFKDFIGRSLQCMGAVEIPDIVATFCHLFLLVLVAFYMEDVGGDGEGCKHNVY
jgi:hypothetical protein